MNNPENFLRKMEMNLDREREILKIIQYDLTDGALVAYLKKLQLVGNYFIELK